MTPQGRFLCFGLLAFALEHATASDSSPPSIQFPLTGRLYGSIHSTAYYVTDLPIGSPKPQRQSLIVDTGSSVMAFGCQDCIRCGDHIDPLFDRTTSDSVDSFPCYGNDEYQCHYCAISRGNFRSASKGHCSYSISYLEGSSLAGLWYSDTAWLGHTEPLPSPANNRRKTAKVAPEVGVPATIPFGCHTEETHLFVEQAASGILGLEVWSSFGPPTFIEAAMNAIKKIANDTVEIPLEGFALCLGESGGVFGVGAPNTAFHDQSKKERQLGPAEVKETVELLLPPRSEDSVAAEPSRVMPEQKLSISDNPRFPVKNPPVQIDKEAMANVIRDDLMSQTEPIPEVEKGANLHESLQGIQWVDVLAKNTYHVMMDQIGVGDRMFKLHNPSRNSGGMKCLVDSGTTLSYLPAIVYVELLLEIEKSVQSRALFSNFFPYAKSEEEKVRIMAMGTTFQDNKNETTSKNPSNDGGAVHHVTGSSYEQLQEALTAVLSNVTKPTATAESNGKSRNLSPYRSEQEEENLDPSEQSAYEQATRRLQSRLAGLGSSNSRGRVLMSEEEVNAASEEERKAVESLFTFLGEHPSAHHRATNVVKMENYVEEECWYLSRGDDDLRHFPKITVEFVGGAQIVWEPSAYLYAKGSKTIRCLAIAPQGVPAEKSVSVFSKAEMRATEISEMNLSYHGHEAVLGSSFFVNHDVIFDVGNEFASATGDGARIGFIKASCPNFDMSSDRPPQFESLAANTYLTKLAEMPA